jgi:hypothetical protein
VLGPLGFADDLGMWAIFAALFAREHGRWRAEVKAGKKSNTHSP